QQKRLLSELKAQITRLDQALAGPMPAVDASQIEWEKTALAGSLLAWEVLDPFEYRSAGGATLKKLDDRSVLASGENPAVETAPFAGRTGLRGIRGLGGGLLADDSLPVRGPGRSHNGNIVLTDVKLEVRPPADGSGGGTGAFKAASADFSQKDFPVANAI